MFLGSIMKPDLEKSENGLDTLRKAVLSFDSIGIIRNELKSVLNKDNHINTGYPLPYTSEEYTRIIKLVYTVTYIINDKESELLKQLASLNLYEIALEQ